MYMPIMDYENHKNNKISEKAEPHYSCLKILRVEHIYYHLIFSADCNNLRKFAELSFHAVDPLNNNNYFLPGSTSPWLSLSNLLSQNFLQVRGCCNQVGEGKT